MKSIQLLAIGALVAIASLPASAQSEIRVPAQHPTIQQALLAAGPGTTIRVAPGVYTENLFWPTVDGIRLVSDVGAVATTIDGGLLARAVNFPTGLTTATVLEGFTITNGRARDGAGIRVLSSPTIRHNVIAGNDALATTQNEGGGIHVSQGSPRIEFNVIRDNQATGGLNGFGGGVFIRAGANPTLVGNQIVNNTAAGAAFAGGGGVYVGGAPGTGALLVSNVIAANAAAGLSTAEGGGVAIVGGPVTIDHCTIADNAVTGPTATGGGVFFASTAVAGSRVQNTIVARSVRGGGIAVVGGAPTIDDNDVWNNAGGDYVGVSAGPNDVSVDPMFVGATDYHLAAGSPLIDAGRNTPIAATEPRDLDGDMRRLDGDLDGQPTRVDVGADEVAQARLTAPRAAFIGGGFPLFVNGPAGSSYVVAASATAGHFVLEPFGPILLGLPFAVVGQGIVPAGVTLPVPAAPALLGQSVHVQAVVYSTNGGLRGTATNADVVSFRTAGPAVSEPFVNQSQLDANASTARWAGGQPGLAAIFGYGGDGSDGDLTVTGTSTLDSSPRTPGADGVVEFNFRNLVVQNGATLALTGTHPIRLNVEQTCQIAGTIQASGQNGANAPPGSAVAVGALPGGVGGPGGGAGGSSNTKPTATLGSLPTDLRGAPGRPRSTTDCNQVNTSENFPLIVFQINCGGGTGGNRGVPVGSLFRDGCAGNGGGHATPGEQTDFLCANAGAFGVAFGDTWALPGGPNQITSPSAGSGGGAGGNAAATLTSGPPPTNDIVAGSGGGAGGGLEVSALGILDVTPTAQILAVGGGGGVGHSTLVGLVTVRAGYGGGGAGGSVWLSGTDVRVATGAVIDARGGTGNPAPPVVSRSGKGGDGYVIIRDSGGTPQVAGTITPTPIAARATLAVPSTSVAVSKFYDGMSNAPNWSFDASNPATGFVRPGNDILFTTPPAPGQTVKVSFQGAPAVNGQPDPNPANWFPANNAFATDISQIAGRQNLRFIRFKIEFDLGPVQKGAPLPNRIVLRRLRIGI